MYKMDFEKKKQHQISEMLPVLTFNNRESSRKSTDNYSENIQCLKCTKQNKFPEERDDYLTHLYLEHRLVIADIDEIALLEDYLKYWHQEFQDNELEEYCTTMLMNQLPDGKPAKNEKYFLLSDVLPKDYELRKRLQNERLKKVLEQHQFERTDRNFSKECLYCRDIISGLRSEYLEHLFHKHFLLLGKPENIVYIDELIAKVQQNLEYLVCLFCKKIFKDRITLKEHMRKKAHKRINPNNKDYDKFFLQNYGLEKANNTQNNNGKQRRQQNSQNVKKMFTQTTNETVSHSNRNMNKESVDFDGRLSPSNDSDSDWSDWDGENALPLNCLFCTHQEITFSAFKKHMQTVHTIDFDASVEGLNFYQKIKVVNYVRRQMCLQRCVTCNLRCETPLLLLEHLTIEKHFSLGTKKQWDKPEYFFPTYEDDSLLCTLDDNLNDNMDETVVRIISEDTTAKINKEAEILSLENFKLL